jgi:hypothetical protein
MSVENGARNLSHSSGVLCLTEIVSLALTQINYVKS